MNHIPKMILFISVFFATSLFALTTTIKTLHIKANSSLFNYKTGVTIYDGNVIIHQGTTCLTAERVVTYANNHHRIAKAVAYGLTHLAEYTSIMPPEKKWLHAKAKMIAFYPLQSTVVLEKNVIITKGNNRFEGEKIIYNLKTQIISAPENKKRQSKIIINEPHFLS